MEWIASELGADIIPPKDFPPAILTRYGQVLLPGFVPGEGQYVAALRKHGETDRIHRGDPLKIIKGKMPPHRWKDNKNAGQDSPHVNVDRKTALQYLHGDALKLPDAPIGLITIRYEGHPLGAAKNLGTRCNNLYPKAKRIRMDV